MCTKMGFYLVVCTLPKMDIFVNLGVIMPMNTWEDFVQYPVVIYYILLNNSTKYWLLINFSIQVQLSINYFFY